MRFPYSAGTVAAALLALSLGGCGGKHAGSGSDDGGGDASRPDVVSDGGGGEPAPSVSCPALAAGETRGLGACCTASADCATGTCWNGFCTKACAGDGDCGTAVAPSPLPPGTTLKCAANMLGAPWNLCIPGSLAACDGTPGGCPSGEGCEIGVDPTTKAPGAGLRGLCMTKLIADRRASAGSACDPTRGAYECEDQGGFLGAGCFARRCTHACAPGDDSTCPSGTTCEGPYATSLPTSGGSGKATLAGAGLCLGKRCGFVQELGGGATTPTRIMGADVLCATGEICAPTLTTGPGDSLVLSCTPPQPGGGAYGAACSKDPSKGMRCKDDALCLTVGAGSFCSTLCRRDGDCPADSLCLEYPGPTLPGGKAALFGLCTPRAKIAGKACQTEKDCGPGEGCQRAGDRTTTLVCGLYGAPDPMGAACSDDGGCTSPRRCVKSGGTGKCTDVSAWKSPGEACTGPGQCRSGDCIDRDLLQSSGAASRAFCGAPCLKNSDCGASERCQRIAFNNNSTPTDPLDDVIFGYCTPLSPPRTADACKDDSVCPTRAPGSDTCDVATGACFNKAAKIGSPCTMNAQCPLGAHCLTEAMSPRFKGGACVAWGCDAASAAPADHCPAGAVCRQRFQDAPLSSCYEGCASDSDCSRAAEGYVCDGAKPGDAKDICQYMASGA